MSRKCEHDWHQASGVCGGAGGYLCYKCGAEKPFSTDVIAAREARIRDA